ncbi:hypothetical protein GCM10022267_31450 [Lentzea roselyniae]|uniref:Secreted protein n=1 Tax=Lentzea roselyniae TaxID=531940 RepID=A0ABP7AWV1_9PSEU
MRHRIATVVTVGAVVACLASGTAATANAAIGADRGEPAVEVCDTGVLDSGLLGSDGSLITDCGLVPDLLGGVGLG